MSVDFGLQDRVAVITGGYGVLCGEISKHFAKRGAKVAILGRREEKAKEAAYKIVKEGGKAIGIGTNVLDKNSLLSAREIVLKEFGTVDILINGAGGNKAEATTSDENSFFDIPLEAMQWVFDLNFMGTVLATQVFGEEMAKKKSGSIINISSMAAITPLTRTISYSAAKAAVSNFTQWMAVHFSQNYSNKIRVNAIAPGFMLTSQNKYLLIDEKTGKMTPRGKSIIDNTPMARYGESDEVVGAAVWLASDASSFVSGAIIPVDGGFSAFSGV